MALPKRFLDELKNRITLSEVIGRRIKVTRAGHEYKACCPFHHEKTPSFTINNDKQFYHCFGCGEHGSVIDFVIKHDNIGFMDAIKMLAAEAGMEVPAQSPQQAAQEKKKKDLYELLEDATTYFEDNLYQGRNQDALGYLLERGLSRETIKQFRIGFAPDDGQALRKFLHAKEYTDKEMMQAGVLRASTRGGDPYAFFRDRIMFPVPDRRGRIVAYGGRILPDHLRPPQRGDFKPPKYINSSETPLFHKGSMLYGEPTARRAAADGQPLILVEGYLDVIACVQAGVSGALAPMGTAVTEEQILSMWRMIPESPRMPVLCFDGDNAGRKAAGRVVDRVLALLEPGSSVSFAFMPDGEDPDSLIKATGVAGFKKIIGRATSLFDFIWHTHTQGRSIKTPDMKAAIKRKLEDEIARIADADVQNFYKSELRGRISKEFYPQRTFGQFRGANTNRPKMMPVRPQSPRGQRQHLVPKVLLAAVINHPEIFDTIEEYISGYKISDPRMEQLRQYLISYLCSHENVERKNLVDHIENAGFFQEIGDICNESVYVHASFCSPSANKENIQSRWLEYWNDCVSAGLDEEIQNGWKRAFFDSDEAEEEKLRSMLVMKTNDSDG
ncbi:MAG: DNA primase [Alcanivorax sp.]